MRTATAAMGNGMRTGMEVKPIPRLAASLAELLDRVPERREGRSAFLDLGWSEASQSSLDRGSEEDEPVRARVRSHSGWILTSLPLEQRDPIADCSPLVRLDDRRSLGHIRVAARLAEATDEAGLSFVDVLGDYASSGLVAVGSDDSSVTGARDGLDLSIPAGCARDCERCEEEKEHDGSGRIESHGGRHPQLQSPTQRLSKSAVQSPNPAR